VVARANEGVQTILAKKAGMKGISERDFVLSGKTNDILEIEFDSAGSFYFFKSRKLIIFEAVAITYRIRSNGGG